MIMKIIFNMKIKFMMPGRKKEDYQMNEENLQELWEVTKMSMKSIYQKKMQTGYLHGFVTGSIAVDHSQTVCKPRVTEFHHSTNQLRHGDYHL